MADDRSDQFATGARERQDIGATVVDFYDALSPFYDLIYQDWPASVERQGDQLDNLIRERWGDSVQDVLDAACGIGTQSIALAARGYHVTASDLSSFAIGRAQAEALARKLSVDFVIDDMRSLHSLGPRAFDLVIACDNAIPHLSSDEEILTALQAFHDRLRPGGGCILSVRDYATLEREGAKLVPFGIRHRGDTRYIVFQVWECDETGYNLNFYFVEDTDGGEPITHVMRSRYYAVTTDTILRLMHEAGFRHVERVDGRFFQPLLIGDRE